MNNSTDSGLATTPAEDSAFDTIEDTAWQRFYYWGKGGYIMALEDGKFLPLPYESQVRQHLNGMGIPGRCHSEMLCKIRSHNLVQWAGPIAGIKCGLHQSEDSGQSFLVTHSPIILEAVRGRCSLIKRIMRGLFDDPNKPDQFIHVMGWLKQARTNVKNGCRRPLQALALVGPRKAGKSLFLEIARIALGGRQASAYRAITGESGFNSQILGAELLTIDDEVASRAPFARICFAQAIKKVFFAPSLLLEAKGKDAFNARPVHALIIALNDEAEHIRVLPEIDHNLKDKISLIKCGRMDVSPSELRDREGFWQYILSEMPAFLYYLENFPVPEELFDERTGVKAYHSEELISKLQEISPEQELYELLIQNQTVRHGFAADGVWQGKAVELKAALEADDATRHASRHLLQRQGSLGDYLGRLAKSRRFCVSKGPQQRGIQTWRLSAPDGWVPGGK